MAKDVTIRAGTADDAPALADMRGRMDRARDADYFDRCMGEITAGRRDMIVAVTDDEAVAGYVMVNHESRYQPFRSAGVPEIQDLYVLPDHRRDGVGERLVAACEDLARARGCDMIGLAVGLHAGFGAAQRLYVRRGYMPDGFGIVYDMERVPEGQTARADDDLNLMMVKSL